MGKIMIFEKQLHMDGMDVEIDMEKLETWMESYIPAEYLDYVQRIILVWDTPRQREWIASFGERVEDTYTFMKEWDLKNHEGTLGVNDPDDETVILFLEVIWDTVVKLMQHIEIDPLHYFNRILLQVLAHELRHIGQMNDIVKFSGPMEDDADEFGKTIYKAHPDMVLIAKKDQGD